MIRNDSMLRIGAAALTFALVMALIPVGHSTGSQSAPGPTLVVGNDLIVSYDEKENLNNALHPSIAVAPPGSPYEGTIHVVWDEMDETDGYHEIHYSMSEDGGRTWNHDMDDFVISNNQKGKFNMGDAVHPSITIDSQGFLHVIWAEHMSIDGTWEVMYSRSEDNGKTWTGNLTGDMMISHRIDGGQDARGISAPKLTVGLVRGKASEILHAVWSEYTEKDGEEVHYSRSLDGGHTWTGTEADDILSIPGGEYALNPDIAVTGMDGAFVNVAWIQKNIYGLDEVWFSRSDGYGDRGTWSEERPLSMIADDGLMAENVTICGGLNDDVHAVWMEYSIGKAPAQQLYYASSPDNGLSWVGSDKDYPVDYADGNPPEMPSVGVGDKRVQVVWTEVDENSPQNTMEIHTSWTDDPLNPETWSGLKGDTVLSNGDDWGPANARNASFQMGFIKGAWTPMFAWDELNDGPSGKNKEGNMNTEIHAPPVEWSLTVTVSGSGTVSKSPDQATYMDGTSVTLTANPSTGWHFDHWGGNLSGSTNPDVILMDSDKSVTAYFLRDPYVDLQALSVSGPASCTEGDSIDIYRSFRNAGTQDSGSFRYGLYLSTNNVITTGDTLIYSFQFGSLTAGAYSNGTITVGLSMGLTGTYYYGLIVDDLAQVAESDEGNNWVASSGTVTINPAQFNLTVNTVGNGSVSKNPDQATYGYMDSVQLTASPDFGWEFDHWGGDLSGSTNPDSIIMDGDKTVTAYFNQITYVIPLTAGWNLVSIPLVQANTSVTAVLSSISGQYDIVKFYNGTDAADPWKTYSPSKSAGLNDLTDIDRTMAIWLHATVDCNLTATGAYPANTSIPLYAGWNFVGYPTQNTTRTVAQALAGTGYDTVEAYDGNATYMLRTLSGTDIMLPGQGYWVHVTADTTWVVEW